MVKPLGKQPFGRPIRWENNIRMDVTEINYANMNLIRDHGSCEITIETCTFQ
jgi:hypothetical protein